MKEAKNMAAILKFKMADIRISGKNGTNSKFVPYVLRKGKNVGSTNVAKANLNLHNYGHVLYYSS